MNSLFQQLQPQQRMMQQQSLGSLPSQKSNDLLKTVLNSSNPKELLNSLISNNPQMKMLVQAMQSSGMTPKDYFYSFARQKGIDPDQFLSSIKNQKGV